MLDLREMRIVVTGASGFVGRHLVKAMEQRGYDVFAPDRHRCNMMESEPPSALSEADVIFHLAAKCGGIGANTISPATFIRDNLLMGMNALESARFYGVKKLIMVGSLCAYPQNIDRPIEPEDLWSGYPEKTNAPYGIAKRTLVEAGRAYHAQFGLNVVNVMPANMYGTGDNFDQQSSHVIPALIRRFTEAKRDGRPSVTCWGSGSATRDFLHVSDAVEGLIRAAEMIDDPEPVLLGSGQEIAMWELARKIADAVGYDGMIKWDISKPDGQPRRVVSTRSQRERLDFTPQIKLVEGLREVVEWYQRKAVAV